MSYHDIMTSNNPNLVVNLGNIETAQIRRQAYEKAAAKEGCRSMGEWVKKHLDKAASYHPPKK